MNAFDPAVADAYTEACASFVLVGADVALLARGSEALASRFVGVADPGRAGYLLHPVRPGSGVSST